MAEAEDLKSSQCGFDPHSGHCWLALLNQVWILLENYPTISFRVYSRKRGRKKTHVFKVIFTARSSKIFKIA